LWQRFHAYRIFTRPFFIKDFERFEISIFQFVLITESVF
jgi:hypothetical protein